MGVKLGFKPTAGIFSSLSGASSPASARLCCCAASSQTPVPTLSLTPFLYPGPFPSHNAMPSETVWRWRSRAVSVLVWATGAPRPRNRDTRVI
jgi:hypothetical protein